MEESLSFAVRNRRREKTIVEYVRIKEEKLLGLRSTAVLLPTAIHRFYASDFSASAARASWGDVHKIFSRYSLTILSMLA